MTQGMKDKVVVITREAAGWESCFPSSCLVRGQTFAGGEVRAGGNSDPD
jgi:hypothetical protein